MSVCRRAVGFTAAKPSNACVFVCFCECMYVYGEFAESFKWHLWHVSLKACDVWLINADKLGIQQHAGGANPPEMCATHFAMKLQKYFYPA